MPQIPSIRKPGSKLTSEVPAQKIDIGMAATEGRSLAEIGQGLGEIGEKLQKAQTLAETTKAENFLETKIADIEARATLDPDNSPEKHRAYQQEISRAMEESSGKISIPRIRDTYMAAAKSKADISKIRLNGLFFKKTIDAGKADLENYLELQRQKYISTNSMKEKSQAIIERNNKLDQMVEAGYIPRDWAAEKKISLNTKWDEDHLQNDLGTKPQFVVEEIKKGENGFYKSVSPEIRQKYLLKAERQLTYLGNRARRQTADNLMIASITHSLTPAMVEEAKLTKSISNTFYTALARKVDRSEIGPTEDKNGPAYMELVNKLTDPEVDFEQSRIDLLNAQAEGKISNEDFRKLYQMHLIPVPGGFKSMAEMFGPEKKKADFEAIVTEDAKKKQALKEQNNFLKSAINFIQSFAGKNQTKAAEMVDKLYDKIQSDANLQKEEYPQAAAKILSQAFIQQHPEIKNAPKTGKVFKDAYGNKIRVYPDGSFSEEGK